MQVDDPPYLPVGTAVSAKYKGAFCEAKVSKVVRVVKCKVTYKMGLGTATVSDEQVKGTLRVGHTVQVKHPERKEYVEATIAKIQDCSQYTVVFDDGDITTLRRTALCLKSGRHFNESETLDQLPLTHPEHFGNPVVGGRRGRRNRQLKEDSSDSEAEDENEPDLEAYMRSVGRVVNIEGSDKKKTKENWFPCLIVSPSIQPTVKINVKDEFLVRSFKDGRYYTVPKKEIIQFHRDMCDKVENSALAEAVNKALNYIDKDELPVHWERNALFKTQVVESDSDYNFSDSSDDEQNEEKDRFVAQLYKFMDDSGTPLNKSPVIANKDVDLHKLFRVVQKLGGYNRVTNKNKWKSVANRLRLPTNQTTFNQVKSVYKKCLFSYEGFHKTLGVTMLNHTRSTKKNRGRSLIRDRDRATPINSPKPDKEDDTGAPEAKEEEKVEEKGKKKAATVVTEVKKEDEKKRKELVVVESSDTNSSDATDQSESVASTSRDTGRPKRIDNKPKDKKPTKPVEKGKAVAEKTVEKKEEEEKQTRSKSQAPKVTPTVTDKKKDTKQTEPATTPKTSQSKAAAKKSDEDKKKGGGGGGGGGVGTSSSSGVGGGGGRKKTSTEEKSSAETSSESSSTATVSHPAVNVGDKLKVYYGPTHESKVTYEAKVLEVDKDPSGLVYLVHYTGWNTRYDEWIAPNRIAENLSAATKAKRLKQSNATPNTPKTSASKTVSATPTSSTSSTATKRGRGMSITGRSAAATEVPRSTTPSSITSTSSRTKSPATPATRSTSRITRLDYSRKTRRTSAQTDMSNHSESDSDSSEGELELTRTRSGTKTEEVIEVKTYKKKPVKATTPSATSKTTTTTVQIKVEETEKNEEVEKPRRITRKVKRSPEKSADDSEDESSGNPPKGRDFDLNQIRSELKGFSKALKVAVNPIDAATAAAASADKDTSSSSSSDDSNNQPLIKLEEVEKKEPVETSSNLEDVYEFKEPEPFEFESRPIKTTPKRKPTRSPEKTPDSPESERKRPKEMVPLVKKEELEDEEKGKDEFDKVRESPSFNVVKSSERNVADVNHVRKSLEESFNDDFDDSNDSTVPVYPNFSDEGDEKSPSEPKNSDVDLFSEKKEDDFQTMSSDDSENANFAPNAYQAKKLHEGSSFLFPKLDDMIKAEVEVKEEAIDIEQKPLVIEEEEAQATNEPSLFDTEPSVPVVKIEDVKEPMPKVTTTKIVDTILQKFSSITKGGDVSTDSEDDRMEIDQIEPEIEEPPPKIELKAKPTSEVAIEVKKHPVSDSDSSDSEQLVIARSDDDSQSNSLDKPDDDEAKENSDSSLSAAQLATTTEDDSQEEQRNFKFDNKSPPSPQVADVSPVKPEPEVKEEEPDSHLHSLLLCEETIPRSPAPSTEGSTMATTEQRSKIKSISEMPFASAPSSSNNKNMLLTEHKVLIKPELQQQQRPQPPPLVLPLDNRENCDAVAVLENTPPTTPESTISNLSPRGDPEELSPNTLENESCKESNDTEPDFLRKRRNSSLNKSSLFSEDDTQMTGEPSTKRLKEDSIPAPCKKRRKSTRMSDEIPSKRGRKPLNRSRHNSDSEEDSEDVSMSGSSTNLALSTFERTTRSPRPSKYNFVVEFEPGLDSNQRIAVLQQKLSDLRKTYVEVKAELAAVERRRKKIRRREREALKASKQEMACA